jgi:two-component system, NtrC family, sensor kinase
MTDVAPTIDAGRRPAGDLLAAETAANLKGSDRSMVSPSVDAPPGVELPPGALDPIASAGRIECGRAMEFAVGTGASRSELLQAVADASPFPVLLCRRSDAVLVHANGKLGELLGAQPSELIGRRAFEFHDDPLAREAAQRELASEGRVREREVRLKARGECVWAVFSLEPLQLSRAMPLRDTVQAPEAAQPADAAHGSQPAAGPELLLGALHDITRWRDARDRLQQSEARFRGFVESSNELVFALDPRGVVTYLSPNVSRLLGHDPGQITGKTLDALVHGCDIPKLWERTQRLREASAAQASSELRLLCSDGSARWFCSTFAPIRNGSGEVVGLTGTAHDITPEKAALEELECARQRLRDAQLQVARCEKMASLGLLMAGIAHEIRTPLGAVQSTQRTISQALDKLGERLHEAFPEALEDSKLGRLLKVLTDSTRVVGDGSTRMTDIVQRLRKFSCAEEAKLCAVDVNAIADDTLALIHHELKHYVAIQRCYGEGVTLMGYPARLNQVLVNLLINAAQAVRARGNGKITLETRAVGDHIEISVSDDGVGIPPENLGQIFACGFTTRHEEGGSGLGLAISKEIIDAHHGSLEVTSQVGAGTTFTVRLPRSLSDCLTRYRGCRF